MKLNKIDPDKVTFGTYYQAFLMSKKSAGNYDTTLSKKGSYLKHSPEDFQQKLKDLAEVQLEEEKTSSQRPRSSLGSISGRMRTDSDIGIDIIETQVDSSVRSS